MKVATCIGMANQGQRCLEAALAHHKLSDQSSTETEPLENVKKQVKTISTQIQFKEKRVEDGVVVKNFKLCDWLTEEIAELQAKQRELEAE